MASKKSDEPNQTVKNRNRAQAPISHDEEMTLNPTTQKRKTGRPTNLPEPWKTMVAKVGSVERLAAEFGVTASVLCLWALGRIDMAAPAKALFDRLYMELHDEP